MLSGFDVKDPVVQITVGFFMKDVTSHSVISLPNIIQSK